MKRLLVLLTLLVLVPVSTSAQDFCEGNFDYDDNVDGSDATVFKEHFGRGGYNNPCPPDGPAPVQKTGQTQCWNENGDEVICRPCVIGGGCYPTGQDGMWEKGVALPEPRFTNNGNGTITDNLTGLIWMKNAFCFGATPWQEALDSCNSLSSGSCGLSDGSIEGDWRLPNRRELFSLIHDAYHNPALSNTAGTGHHTNGNPFTNVSPFEYWSSSSSCGAVNKAVAYVVDFGFGLIELDNKVEYNHSVWCVRGGQ